MESGPVVEEGLNGVPPRQGHEGSPQRAISLSWSSHRRRGVQQQSPQARRRHSFHHHEHWHEGRYLETRHQGWRGWLRTELQLDKNPSAAMSLCESMDDRLESEDLAAGGPEEEGLSQWSLLCFAVGHVLNDMSLAVWLTFTLVFLKGVVGLRPSLAGIVMLAGQGADAFATPLAGVVSDHYKPFLSSRGLSPRKTWYGLGFVIVAGSFHAMMGAPVPSLGLTGAAQVVYYALFAAAYNLGWAFVQINHMVLIPEIASRVHERVRMASARYCFTILSYITVYACMAVFLSSSATTLDPSPSSSSEGVYTAAMFRHIDYLVLAVGTVTGLAFWLGTREKAVPVEARSVTRGSLLQHLVTTHEEEEGKDQPLLLLRDPAPPPAGAAGQQQHWCRWFSRPQFWVRGLIYMSAKVAANIVQIYLPTYLQESLHSDRAYIALVPLIMFIGSFVATLYLEALDSRLGHRITYSLGCIIALVGFTSTGLLGVDSGSTTPKSRDIFFTIFLAGVGTCHMVVTAVALESDLVGAEHGGGGALVFGLFSCLEKLANGVVVFAAQYVEDAISRHQTSLWGIVLHESLSRQAWTMVTIVPGVAALLGLVMVLFVTDAPSSSEATNHGQSGQEEEEHAESAVEGAARRPRV